MASFMVGNMVRSATGLFRDGPHTEARREASQVRLAELLFIPWVDILPKEGDTWVE